MNAFQKGIPSVFVISSPFQALCLVSAIRNLEISDYKVVVISSDRDVQIQSVLNHYNLHYIIRYSGWHRWRMRLYRMTSFIHRKSRYMRLFLGDFRSIDLLYFGLQYVADKSPIVYLDDGNASIALFKGIAYAKPFGPIDERLIKGISKSRGLVFQKYHYSIYSMQNVVGFIVEHNSLSILRKSEDIAMSETIVFVGTNTERYCETMNIPENQFLLSLKQLLIDIRKNNPNRKIVYIPHGADHSENINRICMDLQIDFCRINVPIELYFLDKNSPSCIYGFGSSAIYNLKQMFPEACSCNVLVVPPNALESYYRKKSIADYYLECGIEQITIEI